ncbi:hypothetical protein JYU29_12270 [Tianweitania sp. BSSL-BM11]|uniref:Uncharacterized protein n=1 Tax=Tianweitania aestuarii TaxID=2814886 RepID=A0ABS5RXF1_9HYPH|nr:hypothetical protein [Tianweitania aestuarii]MBS9721460.1 hypothetical protein [Tianweitania aestuarii]
MTQFNSLAPLGGRQRGPEPMDARGRHLFQIFDMLCAAKLDLEERRVMIDVEGLKLPEHDGGLFGGKLLVLAVVIQSARQDRIAFFRGELLQRADAGFQLHLLGQRGEVTLRLGRRQAPTFLHDRHIELQYAMGTDPKRCVGIVVGDLEVIAKVLLTAEFTGVDGLLMIDRVVGEGPFVERSRQGSRHLKRKNTVTNPLRVPAHDGAARY